MDWRPLTTGGSARRKSISNRELLLEAGEGNTDRVKTLIQQGADVNYQDADGNTCLHWAAGSGEKKVINTFLEHESIDVSVENCNYDTALDIAWKTRPNKSARKIMKKITQKAKEIAVPRIISYDDFAEYWASYRTFLEATAGEDYAKEYSIEDVENILTFWCAPWKGENPQEMNICITFQVDKNKYISLIEGKGNIFYNIDWFTDAAKPSAKRNILIIYYERMCAHFKSEWESDMESEQRPDYFHDLIQLVRSDEIYYERYIHDHERDGATRCLLTIRKICQWIRELQEQFSPLPENDQDIEQKVLEIAEETNKENTINARKMFANILQEMNRTNDKIKSCLVFLQGAAEGQTFSYREANILIYFLETFALEDTFPGIPLSRDERRTFAQEKKMYYLRFYPSCGNEDQSFFRNVISTFRRKLLHHKRQWSVKSDWIKGFISKQMEMSSEQFFGKLGKFCMIVKDLCAGKKHPSHSVTGEELKTFFSDLQVKSEKWFLSTGSSTDLTSGKPEDMFKMFCRNLERLHVPKVRQQVIFDLVVNICPKLETGGQNLSKPQLSVLRNKIVHDFQNITAADLMEDLSVAVYDYYRYEVAQEVHRVFSSLTEQPGSWHIEHDLTEALKTVNARYPDFRPHLAQKTEGRFQFYDSSWMTENREKIVEIYVSYLAPIINKHGETGEGDNIIGMGLDLNSVQIRELVEQLWHCTQLCGDGRSSQNHRRETLRQHFHEKLPNIPVDWVLDTVSSVQLHENKELVSELLMILKVLDGLPGREALKRCKFSHEDISLLYEAFMKDKLYANPLARPELTTEDYFLIERTFLSFPNNEVRKAYFRELDLKFVSVRVGDVVLNIRKTFDEVHRGNHLKMDTIKSVFSDYTFLSHLVKLDLKHGPEGKSYLKEPDRIYRVVQEVTDLEYMSSYVLHLLTVSADLKVITERSLKKVLVNCLEGYADISYLQTLVGLKHVRVYNALPDVLKEPRFKQQNVQAVLRTMLQAEAQCVKEIWECDRETVLRAACDGLQDLIDKAKFDDAESLINHVEKLTAGEIDNEWSFNKSKFYDALAFRAWKLQQKTKAKGFFNNALKCLELVSRETSRGYFLLALSRKVYTLEQVSRCCADKTESMANVYEALETAKNLWQEIWHYISQDDGPPPDFAELFQRAKGSVRYQDLLAVSGDHFKYLSIHKLMRLLIHAYTNYASKKSNQNQFHENLEIINDMCNVWRSEAGQNMWARIELGRCMYYRVRNHFGLSEISETPTKTYHETKAKELMVLMHQKEVEQYGHANPSIWVGLRTMMRLKFDPSL